MMRATTRSSINNSPSYQSGARRSSGSIIGARVRRASPSRICQSASVSPSRPVVRTRARTEANSGIAPRGAVGLTISASPHSLITRASAVWVQLLMVRASRLPVPEQPDSILAHLPTVSNVSHYHVINPGPDGALGHEPNINVGARSRVEAKAVAPPAVCPGIHRELLVFPVRWLRADKDRQPSEWTDLLGVDPEAQLIPSATLDAQALAQG